MWHGKGKRVLELGAGCGLVGLLLAAMGAHVMLTDLPTVLDLLRDNAASNADAIAEAGGRLEIEELSWGQDSLPHGWNNADFVLAADLVYHRHLYEPLLQTLLQFDSTTAILVANVRRWKHGERLFFKPAKRHFKMKDLTGSLQLSSIISEMSSGNRLRLYEFVRLNA